MKKHKIEETVRFSTYSYIKDFRVTGKKRFDFVIYDKGCAPNFTFLYSQQILQKLATETYKVRKGFLPTLITELFEPRNEHPYNLRCFSIKTPLLNTVYHGTDSVSVFRTQMLEAFSKQTQEYSSLKVFKNRIKN